MATTDYLPSRESELVTWIGTFRTLIVATPTAYGLTAAQATAYDALATNYVNAYVLASADTTRSPANIVAKDDARRLVITGTRTLAKIIQSYPGTTNQMRSALGLTVPGERTPIPPPAEAPNLDIVSRVGTSVLIKLHDGSGSRRGKPAGVAGASVFSYVGATPPAEVGDWKFEGNTTKTKFPVNFDAELAPGTIVWLTAFWFNPRAESGPGCTPVSAILAGGGMQLAA